MTTNMNALLNNVEWKKIVCAEPDEMPAGDIPFTTHEGVLRIKDIEIPVYQLSDGTRIIPEEALIKLFGGVAWAAPRKNTNNNPAPDRPGSRPALRRLRQRAKK